MSKKVELVRKTPPNQSVREASKRIGKGGVFVGILKGTGTHPGSDATYAEIMWWNEFGTRFIPARPTLRPTIARFNKTGGPIMKDLFKQMMLKKISSAKAKGVIGLKVQSDIQKAMTALKVPPNAPSTIDLKGSSNPLISSGATRQHINWIAT